MFSALQDRLLWRAGLLLSGRIEDYCREYPVPTPIYLQDKLLPITSSDQMLQAANHLRKLFLRRGVLHIQPKVAAVELPRKGRFRVWVNWLEFAQDSVNNAASQSIYYLQQTDHDFRTEMVNWPAMSMPELRDFSPDSCKTA